MLPSQAQSLTIFTDGRLCVGYHSGFSVYHITGDHHPICKIFLAYVFLYIQGVPTKTLYHND